MSTDLGRKEFGWRVLVCVVRGNMDIPINIVLGNCFGDALAAVDMNIRIGEVPAHSISKVYRQKSTFPYLVGYWRPTRL